MKLLSIVSLAALVMLTACNTDSDHWQLTNDVSVMAYKSDPENGKQYLDSGAVSRLALQVDRALIALDDAIHHGQSQPCAFALIFGSKKWVEHLLLNVSRDAVARIGKTHPNVGPRPHARIFVFSG